MSSRTSNPHGHLPLQNKLVHLCIRETQRGEVDDGVASATRHGPDSSAGCSASALGSSSSPLSFSPFSTTTAAPTTRALLLQRRLTSTVAALGGRVADTASGVDFIVYAGPSDAVLARLQAAGPPVVCPTFLEACAAWAERHGKGGNEAESTTGYSDSHTKSSVVVSLPSSPAPPSSSPLPEYSAHLVLPAFWVSRSPSKESGRGASGGGTGTPPPREKDRASHPTSPTAGENAARTTPVPRDSLSPARRRIDNQNRNNNNNTNEKNDKQNVTCLVDDSDDGDYISTQPLAGHSGELSSKLEISNGTFMHGNDQSRMAISQHSQEERQSGATLPVPPPPPPPHALREAENTLLRHKLLRAKADLYIEADRASAQRKRERKQQRRQAKQRQQQQQISGEEGEDQQQQQQPEQPHLRDDDAQDTLPIASSSFPMCSVTTEVGTSPTPDPSADSHAPSTHVGRAPIRMDGSGSSSIIGGCGGVAAVTSSSGSISCTPDSPSQRALSLQTRAVAALTQPLDSFHSIGGSGSSAEATPPVKGGAADAASSQATTAGGGSGGRKHITFDAAAMAAWTPSAAQTQRLPQREINRRNKEMEKEVMAILKREAAAAASGGDESGAQGKTRRAGRRAETKSSAHKEAASPPKEKAKAGRKKTTKKHYNSTVKQEKEESDESPANPAATTTATPAPTTAAPSPPKRQRRRATEHQDDKTSSKHSSSAAATTTAADWLAHNSPEKHHRKSQRQQQKQSFVIALCVANADERAFLADVVTQLGGRVCTDRDMLAIMKRRNAGSGNSGGKNKGGGDGSDNDGSSSSSSSSSDDSEDSEEHAHDGGDGLFFRGRQRRRPTHWVVSPDAPLTAAVLLGKALGCPLLTPRWLYDAIDAQAFPPVDLSLHAHPQYSGGGDREKKEEEEEKGAEGGRGLCCQPTTTTTTTAAEEEEGEEAESPPAADTLVTTGALRRWWEGGQRALQRRRGWRVRDDGVSIDHDIAMQALENLAPARVADGAGARRPFYRPLLWLLDFAIVVGDAGDGGEGDEQEGEETSCGLQADEVANDASSGNNHTKKNAKGTPLMGQKRGRQRRQLAGKNSNSINSSRSDGSDTSIKGAEGLSVAEVAELVRVLGGNIVRSHRVAGGSGGGGSGCSQLSQQQQQQQAGVDAFIRIGSVGANSTADARGGRRTRRRLEKDSEAEATHGKLQITFECAKKRLAVEEQARRASSTDRGSSTNSNNNTHNVQNGTTEEGEESGGTAPPVISVAWLVLVVMTGSLIDHVPFIFPSCSSSSSSSSLPSGKNKEAVAASIAEAKHSTTDAKSASDVSGGCGGDGDKDAFPNKISKGVVGGGAGTSAPPVVTAGVLSSPSAASPTPAQPPLSSLSPAREEKENGFLKQRDLNEMPLTASVAAAKVKNACPPPAGSSTVVTTAVEAAAEAEPLVLSPSTDALLARKRAQGPPSAVKRSQEQYETQEVRHALLCRQQCSLPAPQKQQEQQQQQSQQWQTIESLHADKTEKDFEENEEAVQPSEHHQWLSGEGAVGGGGDNTAGSSLQTTTDESRTFDDQAYSTLGTQYSKNSENNNISSVCRVIHFSQEETPPALMPVPPQAAFSSAHSTNFQIQENRPTSQQPLQANGSAAAGAGDLRSEQPQTNTQLHALSPPPPPPPQYATAADRFLQYTGQVSPVASGAERAAAAALAGGGGGNPFSSTTPSSRSNTQQRLPLTGPETAATTASTLEAGDTQQEKEEKENGKEGSGSYPWAVRVPAMPPSLTPNSPGPVAPPLDTSPLLSSSFSASSLFPPPPPPPPPPPSHPLHPHHDNQDNDSSDDDDDNNGNNNNAPDDYGGSAMDSPHPYHESAAAAGNNANGENGASCETAEPHEGKLNGNENENENEIAEDWDITDDDEVIVY